MFKFGGFEFRKKLGDTYIRAFLMPFIKGKFTKI